MLGEEHPDVHANECGQSGTQAVALGPGGARGVQPVVIQGDPKPTECCASRGAMMPRPGGT